MLDEILSGGVRAAQFEKVGAIVRGKVVGQVVESDEFRQTPGELAAGIVQAQRHMETQEVLLWNDGKVRTQIKVIIQTDQRDDDDDDGRRALYVKGAMLAALRAALTAAHSKFVVGGELAVQYTGDGEPTKKGWNAPKQYKAKYTPPAASVASDAISLDDL